jgi:hypothetical protein
MKYFFHYETGKIEHLSERLLEDNDITVNVLGDLFI